MHVSSRGEGPNVSTLISHYLPSWQKGNVPTPFGCRSPDLLLSGLELSRGFSHSASRPHGQVCGGASTNWSYSRPVGVAEAAMAPARGQRFMRLGASRYPPFCVSWYMSWPRPEPSAQLLSSCSYRSQCRPQRSRLSARNSRSVGNQCF